MDLLLQVEQQDQEPQTAFQVHLLLMQQVVMVVALVLLAQVLLALQIQAMEHQVILGIIQVVHYDGPVALVLLSLNTQSNKGY
jgi:hypothetical protein